MYVDRLIEHIDSNFNYQPKNTVYTWLSKHFGNEGNNQQYSDLLVELQKELKTSLKDVKSMPGLISNFAHNIAKCICYQYQYKPNAMIRSYIDYVISFLEKAYVDLEKNSYDFSELQILIKRIKALPIKFDNRNDVLSYEACNFYRADFYSFIKTGNANKRLLSHYAKSEAVIRHEKPGFSSFFQIRENPLFKYVEYDSKYGRLGRIDFKGGFDNNRASVINKSVALGLFAMKHSSIFSAMPKDVKDQVLSFVAEKEKSSSFIK